MSPDPHSMGDAPSGRPYQLTLVVNTNISMQANEYESLKSKIFERLVAWPNHEFRFGPPTAPVRFSLTFFLWYNIAKDYSMLKDVLLASLFTKETDEIKIECSLWNEKETFYQVLYDSKEGFSTVSDKKSRIVLDLTGYPGDRTQFIELCKRLFVYASCGCSNAELNFKYDVQSVVKSEAQPKTTKKPEVGIDGTKTKEAPASSD